VSRAETGHEGDIRLPRTLGFVSTTALVVGSVIGTGVFLKAAVMTQLVGRASLVLCAWVISGIFSFAGAMVYAELGTLFPNAGGEYVYLRASYGDAVAFCYGWMRLLVGSSGIIASLGVGFAIFSSALLSGNTVWLQETFNVFGHQLKWQFGLQQVIAIGIILTVSAVNVLGVAIGGHIQSFLTLLKCLSIVAIVVAVFRYSNAASWSHLALSSSSPSTSSAFATAVLAALWAYNGWNQMPMVAGEVQDPSRNISKALIVGMGIVLVLYLFANLAYFIQLPASQIATSSSTQYPDALPVASRVAFEIAGSAGLKLISVIFIISTLGALHGTILTSARVPFAMARDGLFFPSVGAINGRTRVPLVSIGLQAAWACLLAISGTFDQLTDYVIFTSWIFYGLAGFSIFLLRHKVRAQATAYRTPCYPLFPLTFVVFAIWLLFSTLKTRPVGSLAGVLLTLSGLPVYGYVRRAYARRLRDSALLETSMQADGTILIAKELS